MGWVVKGEETVCVDLAMELFLSYMTQRTTLQTNLDFWSQRWKTTESNVRKAPNTDDDRCVLFSHENLNTKGNARDPDESEARLQHQVIDAPLNFAWLILLFKIYFVIR